MSELLTPKQVARAMDVSESSIKRWCDKGRIAAQYTAGGHRRIALSDLMAFVRGTQNELVHPEALGLPPTSGRSAKMLDRAMLRLVDALLSGDEGLCREIAFDLYLAEHSLAVISDRVFAAAFNAIGSSWECGSAEIYQERLGCRLMERVLFELRSAIATPPADGPVAIGGTPSGDQYSLGTSITELVLRDIRWNATSLGSNLPAETMSAAIKSYRPQIFWLSCSHIEDRATFIRNYNALFDEFGQDVAFVVGGNALDAELRDEMRFAAYCDSMQHLEGFAQSLAGAIDRKTQDPGGPADDPGGPADAAKKLV